jgi:hypothetical protein
MHVVGRRRTEHRVQTITHFAVNDATELMNRRTHLLQSRRQAVHRILKL